MAASELYDTDFLSWTEQQAAALRQMSGASNSLDIAHLAEEIEDSGKCDLREVESLVQQILPHAAKVAIDPESQSVGHWRSEITAFRQSARRAFAPSMRQAIDLASLWLDAAATLAAPSPRPQRLAILAEAERTGCPATLDQVLASSLDIDEFLALFAAPAAAEAS